MGLDCSIKSDTVFRMRGSLNGSPFLKQSKMKKYLFIVLALMACQSQDDFLDEACSCKIEIDETKREWVTFYYRGCDYCCQVMSIPILECRTPAMQDSVGRQFLRELYGRKPHCDPSNEYAITDEILRAKGLRTIIGKAE